MDAHTTSLGAPRRGGAPHHPTGGGTAPPTAARASATPRRFRPATQPLPARDHRPPTRPATLTAEHAIVTLTCPSGGAGLSTFAAMLARSIAARGPSCALVDADLDGGGIDVLLGIEDAPGLSMQELHAPLGTIDGAALTQELVSWERVHVLPYAPWRGDEPDPWEIEAAVTALATANQVVVVDAGRGRVFDEVPELRLSTQLVCVELSVLGLARAKVHLAGLRGADGARPLLVGVETRGAPRGADAVALAEASTYLGGGLLGPIRMVPNLCGGILEGRGIDGIPRRNRRLVADVAERVVAAAGAVMAPREGP